MDSSNSCVFFKSATCSTDGDSVSPSLSITNFLRKYEQHILSQDGSKIQQRIDNMQMMITSLQRRGLSDVHIIEVGYCFNMSGSKNFEKFCEYAAYKIFKFYSECRISDSALRQMYLKCIVMETIYRIVHNVYRKKPTAIELSGIFVEYMGLLALKSSREILCDCGKMDLSIQHWWRGNDIGCKHCGSGFEIKSSLFGSKGYTKDYGCKKILHCGINGHMNVYNKDICLRIPDDSLHISCYINDKGLYKGKMCGDLMPKLNEIHSTVFSEDCKMYPEFGMKMEFKY